MIDYTCFYFKTRKTEPNHKENGEIKMSKDKKPLFPHEPGDYFDARGDPRDKDDQLITPYPGPDYSLDDEPMFSETDILFENFIEARDAYDEATRHFIEFVGKSEVPANSNADAQGNYPKPEKEAMTQEEWEVIRDVQLTYTTHFTLLNNAYEETGKYFYKCQQALMDYLPHKAWVKYGPNGYGVEYDHTAPGLVTIGVVTDVWQESEAGGFLTADMLIKKRPFKGRL